jgi:heterodisulfide reductase subunit A
VQQPARIHAEQCTDCGECFSACPKPGALIKSPLDGTISVDEEVCAYFIDGSCQACIEACGENAVDLKTSPEELEIEVSAVVVASGFKPFDPRDKPRFGYGRVPGVITSLELDSLIRNNNFDPGDGESRVQSIAFIQCVGSRDVKLGHNYCSRICCGQSLRLARVMRRRFEGIDPTMFYMDIQSFDREFEARLDQIKREVRLVRAIPGEIRLGVNQRPELIYQGPSDANVVESFDLVVLSIGIAPNPSAQALGDLLGMEPNEDGFLGLNEERVSTNAQGVFVAGTVQGPKSIEETIFHAVRAAGSVATFIQTRRHRDAV